MTDHNEHGLQIMVPGPERLLSAREVAAIPGWTAGYLNFRLKLFSKFPAPVFLCSKGRYWRASTVIRWIEDQARYGKEPIDKRRQQQLDNLDRLLGPEPGARGGLCA